MEAKVDGQRMNQEATAVCEVWNKGITEKVRRETYERDVKLKNQLFHDPMNGQIEKDDHRRVVWPFA